MLRRDAISHRAGPRHTADSNVAEWLRPRAGGYSARAIQAQQDPTEERMTQMDESIDTNESPTTHEGTDRRAMLRKMAIGGAGAAVAVTALGKTAEAGDQTGVRSMASRSTRRNEHRARRRPLSCTDPAAAVTVGPSAFSVSNAAPAATAPFPANVGGYGNDDSRERRARLDGQVAGFGVVAANTAPGGPAQVLLATGRRQSLAGARPTRHPRRRRAVRRQGRHAVVHGAAPHQTAAHGQVRFVKLAGTPTSGTFHSIAPQRAYDSRQSRRTRRTDCWRRTQSRVVSVADGHNAAGAVTLANAVPARRNCGGDQPDGCGPDRQELPGGGAGRCDGDVDVAAQLEPGVTQIANSITVKLDADAPDQGVLRRSGRQHNFIVDVFGYYL